MGPHLCKTSLTGVVVEYSNVSLNSNVFTKEHKKENPNLKLLLNTRPKPTQDTLPDFAASLAKA